MVPAWESGDAYVRWVDGATYICPWQTRLRSWLGLSRLRTAVPQLWSAAFAAEAVEAAVSSFARCQGQRHLAAHPHPDPDLVGAPGLVRPVRARRALARAGRGRRSGGRWPGDGHADPHAHLRHRDGAGPPAGAAGAGRLPARSAPPQAAGLADDAAPRVVAELEQIGCWLEEFHPDSLVELDYGGLVHLLDDGALRADQSVAEVSAAISALSAGEPELATAMYGG